MIKQLIVNGNLLARYKMQDNEGNILYLKIIKDNPSFYYENSIICIISEIEKRHFEYVAYLNIIPIK